MLLLSCITYVFYKVKRERGINGQKTRDSAVPLYVRVQLHNLLYAHSLEWQ
jgi:hypothetical protein